MRICRTLFSVFLAAAFFPDERNALENRLFQSGLLPAFIGVILIIMGSQNFGHVEFNLGILLMLLAAASWPLLTALVKKWLPGIPASFSALVFRVHCAHNCYPVVSSDGYCDYQMEPPA